MRLSKYAAYGIMILQDLRHARKPLTQYQLAETAGVTHTYIQQVLMRLIAAGLVTSVRGPNGGYVLAHRRKKATVLDVVQATAMADKDRPKPDNARLCDITTKVDTYLFESLKTIQVDAL